jgi:hypothetical protein
MAHDAETEKRDTRAHGAALHLDPGERHLYRPQMPRLVLLDLHPSPFSERVRWVLDANGLSYSRRTHQPIAGEDETHRHHRGGRVLPAAA